MWNSPWTKRAVASSKKEVLWANLYDIFTFDDIEPLVLVMVPMTGGTTLRVVRQLNHQQRTLTVISCNFECENAESNIMALIEAIITRCDLNWLPWHVWHDRISLPLRATYRTRLVSHPAWMTLTRQCIRHRA
jgi:hypothetical protein